MTVEEAIAAVHARWSHPPLDRRDVEERVAIRLVDEDDPPLVLVLELTPACRVFRLLRDDEDHRKRRWRSAYVHSTAQLDQALDWVLEDPFAHASRRSAA